MHTSLRPSSPDLLLLLLCAGAACNWRTASPGDTGPDTAVSPPDSDPQDTGPQDTGPQDTGPQDTGSPPTGVHLDLDDADARLLGLDISDNLGESVTITPDLDGDGLGDLLLCAADEGGGDYGNGAVYVAYGVLSGQAEVSVDLGARMEGGDQEWACYFTGSAGDVDLDGVAEFMVGPWTNANVTATTRLFLFPDPPTGEGQMEDLGYVVDGLVSAPSSAYRPDVARTGDVDGDGWLDLLVGDPWNSDQGTHQGAAHLFSGPLDGDRTTSEAVTTFYGQGEHETAGYAVALGTDLDGDGAVDPLIAAPPVEDQRDVGIVYGVLDPPAATVALADADLMLTGEQAGSGGDDAGFSLESGFDEDGDGYTDLLVGAPESDLHGEMKGAVYLLRGPLAGEGSLADAEAVLFAGAGEGQDEGAGSAVGFSLSHGDLDGDGRADPVITNPGGASPAVFALLEPVAGHVDLQEAPVRIDPVYHSEEMGSSALALRLGRSVSAGGDVDGDGLAEILVGDPVFEEFDPEGEPGTTGSWGLAALYYGTTLSGR